MDSKKNSKKSWLAIIGFIFLGLIIGLLAIVHLRSNAARNTGSSKSIDELKKMALNLGKQQEDSKKQISELEKKISDTQKNLKETKNISGGNLDKLQKDKDEAGLSSQEGTGIVITVADNQNESSGNAESFLIHASDLRDMVNLLWLSGAKAISINNERIIFLSSIDCLVNTILVNNTKLGSPYKIAAIVDQDKIKSYLENNDYLLDFKNRAKKNNLIFNTEYQNKVQIPAYSSSLIFNYIK